MNKDNIFSALVGVGIGVGLTLVYPKAKKIAKDKYEEYKNKKQESKPATDGENKEEKK